ncbi:ankyrin repeat-containing domain protein [Russula earlei]|uniref:Ankyrin repeat-containing domain protein n=1 Tax=Russula earlei TaxID=71964 RepID=A0ACC0UKZ6_9AGAM|nr:ankyrin repeat-containing domain protein [Russula earlei]
MAEDHDQVATYNRLLHDAARSDNVDQLLEVFAKSDKFDINFQDGIGNTALHWAASEGSLDALNELLEYEDCDVDLVNRLEGATPLHLAVKIKEPELRALIVDSLLDAGADTSIKDKAGLVALEYVAEDDKETRNAFLRHQAERSISKYDIASDDDDDDDDEEYDSESGEE